MSDVSAEDLRKEVQAILKDADLSTISAKRVREQVELKLNCSLISRKKEFDKIVMDVINSQQNDDDDEDSDPDAEPEEEASEEEEEDSEDESSKKKKPLLKKRPQPTKHKSAAAKKKRKSLNASDSGTESDGGSDSDYEVPKKTPATAAKKKKAAGAGGAATGRKGTGFTRAYTLSPELSALMGAEALPRHEVVKKVWAIIKERDLYDPKNKQFAICDDELMKVMKVKRFRTFGMLKHLKPHFLD